MLLPVTSPSKAGNAFHFRPRPIGDLFTQHKQRVVYECHRCRKRWPYQRVSCDCEPSQMLHPVLVSDCADAKIS